MTVDNFPIRMTFPLFKKKNYCNPSNDAALYNFKNKDIKLRISEEKCKRKEYLSAPCVDRKRAECANIYNEDINAMIHGLFYVNSLIETLRIPNSLMY